MPLSQAQADAIIALISLHKFICHLNIEFVIAPKYTLKGCFMGNLDFQLTKEKLTDGSSVALLHMKGSIDGTTVKKFESKTLGLYEEGIKYLILNFFEVGYMNSTGLGILVKVLDKFQEKDGDVKLVKVPRKVADLFDMLGISSIVTIYPGMEEAIQSLPFPIQSAMTSHSAEVIKKETIEPPAPPRGFVIEQPKSDDLLQDTGILIAPDDAGGIAISPEPEVSIDQPVPIVSISSEENLEGGIAIDAEWETATEEEKKESISSSTAAEFFEISPIEEEYPKTNEQAVSDGMELGIDLSNMEELSDSPSFDIGQKTEEEKREDNADWSIEAEPMGFADEQASTIKEDQAEEIQESIATFEEIQDSKDAQEEIAAPEFEEVAFEEPAQEEIAAPEFEEAAFEEPAQEEITVPESPEAAFEEPAQEEIAAAESPEAAFEEPAQQEIAAPESPEASFEEPVQEELSAPESPEASFEEVQDSDDEQEKLAAPSFEEVQDSDELSAPDGLEEIDLPETSQKMQEASDINLSADAPNAGLPDLSLDLEEAFQEASGEKMVPEMGKQKIDSLQTEIEFPCDALKSIPNMAEDTDLLETQVSSNYKSVASSDIPAIATSIKDTSTTLEKAVAELEEEVQEESRLERRVEQEAVSAPAFASAPASPAPMPVSPMMPFDEDKKEDVPDDIVNAFRDSEEQLLANRSAKEEQSKKSVTKIPTSGSIPPVKGKAPFKRKTTVRYYEQMNPSKSYPLSVTLSKDKVVATKMAHVAQKEGKKDLVISADKPKVTITPVLSGCHVAPQSITLDVTQEVSRADFWVTPIIEGSMYGWIEITHQGETIEKIDIQTKSVKQTWAKIAAAASVLSPFFSSFMEGILTQKESLKGLPRFLMDFSDKIGGLTMLGIGGFVLFMVAGIVFYRRSLPKEAQEIEKFFGAE